MTVLRLGTILTLIAAVLAIFGCNEKANEENNKGSRQEELHRTCSVKLPGVHFTKSLNGATEGCTVNGSVITVKSEAKKDYFNDPDGKLSNNTAPVLLSKVDNTKPFTLTTKVTPVFNATYDAGALYIFSDEMLWQKFAFEQDERGRRRIVSVRTIETSDDNNHEQITQDSVFLKVSSDTKTVGFYYSIDGSSWNLARLYKNNYPSTIWVGISSQSPVGNGNTTTFENCTLTESAIKDFRTGM
jgi:uncharacterized protein